MTHPRHLQWRESLAAPQLPLFHTSHLGRVHPRSPRARGRQTGYLSGMTDMYDEDSAVSHDTLSALDEIETVPRPRYVSLELTNFLSYKSASLAFGDFIALVGPNASGKSNAVAAIKLLREIPSYGLQTAIARRGGFDQLRHRSAGRPYDPTIRLTFAFGDSDRSSYELRLGAVKGQRYRVKKESAEISGRGSASLLIVTARRWFGPSSAAARVTQTVATSSCLPARARSAPEASAGTWSSRPFNQCKRSR